MAPMELQRISCGCSRGWGIFRDERRASFDPYPAVIRILLAGTVCAIIVALLHAIVRGFPRDGNVMGVRFSETAGRDSAELRA